MRDSWAFVLSWVQPASFLRMLSRQSAAYLHPDVHRRTRTHISWRVQVLETQPFTPLDLLHELRMPPWSAFHVPRRRDLALENIPASMSERAANDESQSRFELSVNAITCSLDRSSYLGSSPKWLEQGAEAAGLSKGAQDARPTWAQALRLSVDQFRRMMLSQAIQ